MSGKACRCHGKTVTILYYRRTRNCFSNYSGLDASFHLPDPAELGQRLLAGEKMILVFWHGKYFKLLPLLGQRDACVFTSLSTRGDAIRDILEPFGFRSVQLTDLGHEHSLDLMRETLHHCNVAAIAVDGPLEPV